MLVIQSIALAAHSNMKVAKKRKKTKVTRAEKCLKTHFSTSNFSQISIDNENINSLCKCQRFMRSLLWNIRLHSTSFVPAINQRLLNQDSSHRCCLQAAWKISSVSLLSSSSKIRLTRKEKNLWMSRKNYRGTFSPHDCVMLVTNYTFPKFGWIPLSLPFSVYKHIKITIHRGR